MAEVFILCDECKIKYNTTQSYYKHFEFGCNEDKHHRYFIYDLDNIMKYVDIYNDLPGKELKELCTFTSERVENAICCIVDYEESRSGTIIKYSHELSNHKIISIIPNDVTMYNYIYNILLLKQEHIFYRFSKNDNMLDELKEIIIPSRSIDDQLTFCNYITELYSAINIIIKLSNNPLTNLMNY
jgi:hypothetical protein